MTAKQPAMGCLISSFWACLGLSVLFSSAFLAMLMRAQDRQDLFWSKTDTIALFIVVLAIAAFLHLGYIVLLKTISARVFNRLFHLLFVVVAFGLIQLFPAKVWTTVGIPPDWGYGSILLAGLGLSALSAFGFLPNARIVLWKVCVAMALLYPLLFGQLILKPSFIAAADLDGTIFEPHGTTAPSVVIFVFDSISMAQCVDANGEWRPDLPALDALCAGSLYFENAVSCGVGTTMSLPNFLFQRDPVEFNCNAWNDSWFGINPLSFTNGILYSAKEQGYHTAAVGTYLPFSQMFHPLLDGCLEFPLTRFVSPTSFAHRLANSALSILAYARGPFQGSIVAGIPRLRWVPTWMSERYFAQTTRQAQAAIETHLQRMGPQGYLFFAYMAIPHSPAIFLPDGQIDSMLATYETQLKYTDNVLGNFLEVMKAQGTYDHSWVLVTSDHGHHGFDLSPTEHRHVPFIVKAPGSQCAGPVRPSLPLWRLAPFFQNIFAGKDVASCIRALPVPVGLKNEE